MKKEEGRKEGEGRRKELEGRRREKMKEARKTKEG